MSAANEAAAGLSTGLAAELVQKFPPADAENDRLRADVVAAIPETQEPPNIMQSVEAPETVSSEEAAAAQVVEQEAAAENELDIPNYTPEIPDDLLEELEEPDFAAETEQELSANDDEYIYDEQESEERKLRIAAEKKAAWLEGRLQEQNRGKWESEARKYFPLSEHSLSNIKADSRRSFLKQAKAAHEAILPAVKPLLDRLTEAAEQERTRAKQEGRASAEAAWGKPTTGPGVAPVTTNAEKAELEEARRSGASLAARVGLLMKQGGVK